MAMPATALEWIKANPDRFLAALGTLYVALSRVLAPGSKAGRLVGALFPDMLKFAALALGRPIPGTPAPPLPVTVVISEKPDAK